MQWAEGGEEGRPSERGRVCVAHMNPIKSCEPVITASAGMLGRGDSVCRVRGFESRLQVATVPLVSRPTGHRTTDTRVLATLTSRPSLLSWLISCAASVHHDAAAPHEVR